MADQNGHFLFSTMSTSMPIERGVADRYDTGPRSKVTL